jgi:hypothetical protein
VSATADPARLAPAARGPRGETATPVARPRRRLVSGGTIESLVIFVVALAAYFGLGDQVVLHQHVVVGDGLSRLTHAFLAWHNDPPKLAAIGFFWPPLETMSFLPLTAIKPLATSLVALPLGSAIYAAGTIVVLDRCFCFLGLAWPARLVLLLLFAVNPMFAWYAANGMAESGALFFLALTFALFVKWLQTDRHHLLILCGTALALGTLYRFEMMAWAALVAAAVAVQLMLRRRPASEVEGTLVALLAPVAFVMSVWIFLNWTIAGSAFGWVSSQAVNNFSSTGGTYRGAVTAQHTAITIGNVAERLLDVNAGIFVPTLIVVPVLLVAGVVRRDVGAVTLAIAGVVNILTTAAGIYAAHADYQLELRYNMRAMPIVMIGLGYLVWMVGGRWRKWLAVAGGAAVLGAALPLTWHVMYTWPINDYEPYFVDALKTGKDQEGRVLRGASLQHDTLGIGAERKMAAYVDRVSPRRGRVLTDDVFTFGVLLVGGHPERYLDRIDRGDTYWTRVRDHPFGRVDYFLVGDAAADLIRQRYPGLLDGYVPRWAKLAYRVGPYRLFRIARGQRPALRQSSSTRFPTARRSSSARSASAPSSSG